MKVYLDSDVIVASYDTRDILHANAVNLGNKISGKNLNIVVGVNILIEVLTMVSQRVGMKKSKELLDYFYQDCEIVYLDSEIISKANIIFKKRTSKNISYSDCISFAIMKVMKIKKVFSFDNHFKKQGFEMLK